MRSAGVFARNLEMVLFDLCRTSDASWDDPSDMSRRFEALRGYGKLPRGRENRGKRLVDAEIAHAVLGLTPNLPGWAGHAAIVLGKLRPVGGLSASFLGSPTLLGALERLLTSDDARHALVSVTLSMAEAGINSSGFAFLHCRDGDEVRSVSFVSELAVSLLQPEAEKKFDPLHRHAPASRQLVLNQRFFARLALEVERSLRRPEPTGDGSEYDSDDARRGRHKALGIGPQSRFLNIGVNTQVVWPKQETLVEFGPHRLVLMPKTGESTPSVHVDLHANRLTDREAMTVVNRFLSVMAWCSDQFAISEGGWSGNPAPVPVPRRDLAFVTTPHWIFDRSIALSYEVLRALAHYREGRNAEEAGLVSYAVLSYVKIIELRHEDGPKAKRWIGGNIDALWASDPADPDRTRFDSSRGTESPEVYLWSACRVAVAHASVKHPSDADDMAEINRLQVASSVLRRLARHMISHELGVSDQIFSGT
jgi:hypothetical protein